MYEPRLRGWSNKRKLRLRGRRKTIRDVMWQVQVIVPDFPVLRMRRNPPGQGIDEYIGRSRKAGPRWIWWSVTRRNTSRCVNTVVSSSTEPSRKWKTRRDVTRSPSTACGQSPTSMNVPSTVFSATNHAPSPKDGGRERGRQQVRTQQERCYPCLEQKLLSRRRTFMNDEGYAGQQSGFQTGDNVSHQECAVGITQYE